MKKRGFHLVSARLYAGGILVIALIGILFLFMRNTQEMTKNYNIEVLSETTSQRKRILNRIHADFQTSINSIAEFAADHLLSEETRMEALQKLEEDTFFDYVRFISKEGINYSSLGAQTDCSDREYYLNGMKGLSGYLFIKESRQNAEAMIGFYSPIRKGDSVEGVALGFINQEKTLNLLSSEYFGFNLHSYLVEDSGIIVASSEVSEVDVNIFNLLDTMHLASFRTAFHSKNLKQDGNVIYIQPVDPSKVTDIVFMTYLESSGLILVQIFPSEAQSEVISKLGSTGSHLFISLLVVFGLYFIFIIILNAYQNSSAMRLQTLVTSSVGDEMDTIFAYSEKGKNLLVLKDSHRLPFLESSTNDGVVEASSFLRNIANKYITKYERENFFSECAKGMSFEGTYGSEVYHQTVPLVINNKPEYFKISYIPVQMRKDRYKVISSSIVTEIVSKQMEEKYLLQNALHKAEEATKAKSTFLANMSHDIRTPMNAILGFTRLASRHMNDEAALKNDLEKITVSSNHLLSLINDILDMTKIEGGKIQLEEKACSLASIFNSLSSINQTELARKSLSYHAYADELVHENVFCDKLRLNQILLNCLSNAIKYTPEGGMITLSIRELNPQEDRSTFEFHIKDTGIGMSKEFLQHIFEPFERERNSTVSGIQGTGLGMTITKNLVDLMHGTITVESEEGKGTEFIIRLPFRIVSGGMGHDIDYFHGMKAMVIGSTDACRTATSNLYRLGLDVIRTYTDEESYARAKGTGVFFIDKRMSDRYGLDFVTKLKSAAMVDDVVVILASYEFRDEFKAQAKSHGVTTFAQKPIFTSDLEKMLVDYLQKKVDDQTEVKINLEGIKVLLVEDNALNRDIAEFILTDAGLTVDMVEDGQKAVECISAAPAGTYDLILMDIQMPVMDGYEASKAIRALPEKAKATIPIVAMTANAFEDDKKKSREAGMDAHVAKPIDVNILFYTLGEIFKARGYQI